MDSPAPFDPEFLHGLRLVSSNRRKLAEFRQLGLPMELADGVDLPEVDGTPDEVILHKSLAAGPGTLIEDTILEIGGQPMVDIRWRIGELEALEGVPAAAVVSLAANDGDTIRVWRGTVRGTLRSPPSVPVDAFGFDPFFVPMAAGGASLHDLVLQGRKHQFSPRALAVRALLSKEPHLQESVSGMRPWTGGWQAKGG